jgi:chloramphenicol O-acetyltransferase type A
LKKCNNKRKNQTTVGLLHLEHDNVIHFSAIPWLNYITRTQEAMFPDSCPKISFGKMITADDGTKTMAMSIHVHHGLIDGFATRSIC